MIFSKILKEKEKQLAKEYHEKYRPIFDIVIHDLKHQDVAMYGGTALNEYLPKQLKIYEKYELPDIDVFCTKPMKLARHLAALLNEKGYKEHTSLGNALHENTIQVFCMGLKIIDISKISYPNMKRIKSNGMKGDLGITCVSPEYLCLTLHLMLGTASVNRWEKVYDRLARFDSVFPPRNHSLTPYISSNNDMKEVCHAIHKWTETTSAVLLGTPTMHLILDTPEHDHVYDKLPYNILMVEEDCLSYAKNLVKNVAVAQGGSAVLQVSKVHPANESLYVPAHVVITWNDHPIALIFETLDKCFSFHTYKGMRVGTVHVVLAIYLAMLLSPESHFAKMKHILEVVTDKISWVVTKQQDSHKKIMIPISLTCIGNESGIATLRRKKFAVK
jgi:Poly(A) polymerase catalytic subunit